MNSYSKTDTYDTIYSNGRYILYGKKNEYLVCERDNDTTAKPMNVLAHDIPPISCFVHSDQVI